ncbi:hypothetical protein K4F52_002738 [Lecanicillium sp. MT-2017a]|nr:hypothetical protein K4F52_002738 [Lecanicillium sp. MT-2017a]
MAPSASPLLSVILCLSCFTVAAPFASNYNPATGEPNPEIVQATSVDVIYASPMVHSANPSVLDIGGDLTIWAGSDSILPFVASPAVTFGILGVREAYGADYAHR